MSVNLRTSVIRNYILRRNTREGTGQEMFLMWLVSKVIMTKRAPYSAEPLSKAYRLGTCHIPHPHDQGLISLSNPAMKKLSAQPPA